MKELPILNSNSWQIFPLVEPKPWLIERVGNYAAQLLWQRGLQTESEIQAFLNPSAYTPTGAFAFGEEMIWAIERIKAAREQRHKVAIWGDFDADGITATSVLWDGLGQFFPQGEQLIYFIPNRLTASHGLSVSGIDTLRDCQLIITCDTGSTNLKEIDYLRSLEIDVIITDHHTLPEHRPPVTAIINPRYLSSDHPLFHLSGVAVAYKLIEALYETMPHIPTQPVESLLDLVAIGLVADLVQLSGDCRYLAQKGIEELKKKNRLGVKFLLEACKKEGDRPTDISFGIAPRINSISRIWGDVHKCVEMLTSSDPIQCQALVDLAEEANNQRKALQKKIYNQVLERIINIDLSTSPILVLADANWHGGILGVVAGQIAQEYNRPVILLNIDGDTLRGSARSPQGIDLYSLIKGQEHILTSFGGHPYAAGLSLSIQNLELFKESLIQKFWQQYGTISPKAIAIDLVVTIAELGQELFRELKQLEPHGMGNPAPKLLIKNCRFTNKFNANIKNRRGQKLQYLKSEFKLVDATGSINGHWWEQSIDQVPDHPCDVVLELVDNPRTRTYEVRIIDVAPLADSLPETETYNQIIKLEPFVTKAGLKLSPNLQGEDLWQRLVGVAKYLSRTGQTVTYTQLQNKLGINMPILQLGLKALEVYGWQIQENSEDLRINFPQRQTYPDYNQVPPEVEYFVKFVNEAAFRQSFAPSQV
ncbi:single-stranded-DNA-specific exonuclease RecJ [Synechococcus sp. PCC 7502]|uniref:single-stranded-DNA-specific exonuclease RecJ n=1 Tax=Synechococcus sp. PCC 7502 TaxID=1173263 RepID=UPI00029FCE3C|nr:single-stranded-DNA-specific exonuclease RecJ [Synechococcus sp. PCC 7502]AFY74496.1 single-stranded-DNA-specific exonuclease RecJ [Synechococcus sp. PCC 7502]